MTKFTILSERLHCLLNEVSYTERLIDVGSDHGHVAAFALENKKAGYVIATDIHLSPANRTKEYLAIQGLSEMSDVFCTDGLAGITLNIGDTVIIAGMGGLEMISILRNALVLHGGFFPEGVRFILQPQRSLEELRGFLSESGYPIEKEILCFDRNRFYVGIITAYTGKPYRMNLCERLIGQDLIRRKPDGYSLYLSQRKASLIKQSAGRNDLDEVIRFIDSETSTQQKENKS